MQKIKYCCYCPCWPWKDNISW